jgi:hypothetical protein
MTCRRLILAIVAAVLCGMAWWLSLDRLSAEERLLVGTWTYGGKSGVGACGMRFWPNRHCAFGKADRDGTLSLDEWFGRWFVRDGVVKFDGEPSAVSRAFRPVVRTVGLPTNGAVTYGLESITPDKIVLVMPDGTRETWTRAPAE